MRQCGDCQLCCKLVPVKELGKLANTRCAHQRTGKGCMIYNTRRMPFSCQVWNCRWLVEDDTADLSRPDRSHYVIDIMPDFVTMSDENGPVAKIPVLQVWVDPAYPNAWHDPRLKAYIARRGKEDGMAALIRFGNDSVISVFPPAITGADWIIRTDGILTGTHTPADIFEAGFNMIMEEIP